MPLQTETIEVPVSKGVDLRTAARIVDAGHLLEAINSRFSGDGSSKRFGHLTERAKFGSYPAGQTQLSLDIPVLTAYGQKILDQEWLMGWGDIVSQNRVVNTTTLQTSPYPEAGYLLGGATRDTQVLGWSGHSLIDRAPAQAGLLSTALPGSAVMPAMKVKPIAKTSLKQDMPDVADTGVVRTTVWLDLTTPQVYFTVTDSVTGATLLHDVSLGITLPKNVRCFTLGHYTHIAIQETSTNTLQLRSFIDTDLSTIISRSLGSCDNGLFDIWKVDETRAVTVRAVAGVPNIRWIRVNGTDHPDYIPGAMGIGGRTVFKLAICVHPVNEEVGFAAMCTGGTNDIIGSVHLPNGSPRAILSFETLGVSERNDPVNEIAIAPKYLYTSDGYGVFDLYASTNYPAGIPADIDFRTVRYRFSLNLGALGSTQIFHQSITSQAIRVGDRTYVWSAFYKSKRSTETGAAVYTPLQSTWFLLDEDLKPVAKFDFGVACTPDHTKSWHKRSVNWNLVGTFANPATQGLGTVLQTPLKDIARYYGGLLYNVRVPTTATQNVLFTEPSVQMWDLDFLPALQSAQAGRCTYFAGGQLWAFDGVDLVEAGFHTCPEHSLVLAAGGALTASQPYSYRVDLCHRNAQNEEIRSHSLLFNLSTTPGNQTITLDIPTVLTRRTNSYFLIFRSAVVAGIPTTTWNLINSRDPSSADYRANTQSLQSVAFTDAGAVTDALGLLREFHPMNAGTSYLQPFSAPACELVTAGRDRLWVAGGELLPGQIAPSRLFEPGEVPAFNASIWRQVDRSDDPVTAIGFVGDVGVFFRRNSTYLLDGDGPDNIGQGFWAPARLALSDTGAVSQFSLVLVSAGLLFQSPAGFRLLGPGGALTAVGMPVDPVAKTFEVRGAVSVVADQEVRWYGPSGAIVYDYIDDAWTTWTCKAFGAVHNPVTGRAILMFGTKFFIETEGEYLDDGQAYEHRIKFPWLHAGNLGDFQRVTRIAGFGLWDSSAPHSVRVEIAYDERDFPEEYFEWNVPDVSQNTDTWGTVTWGAGTWGDTASTRGIRDSVWRWRRKPARQKCSVFSVTISDKSSANQGFSVVALGCQIGKKSGLDRSAWPTGGTDTYKA